MLAFITGIKTGTCAIVTVPERQVSFQKEWPFCSFPVLWLRPHPWWCFGFLFPAKIPHTFQNPQKQTNSLLCNARCRHTFAATVELWRPAQKLCYSLDMQHGQWSRENEKTQPFSFTLIRLLAGSFFTRFSDRTCFFHVCVFSADICVSFYESLSIRTTAFFKLTAFDGLKEYFWFFSIMSDMYAICTFPRL